MAKPEAATILLLIDLQAAFCDPEGSMAQQGRDIDAMRAAAATASGLADAARAASVPIVWTRIVYRDDYLDGGRMLWEVRPNLRRIGALRAGTPDAAISDAAGYVEGEPVIDKTRYSALYATPLEALLRSLGVRRVIVGGVTTSMCVETTVRDLGQRDYETFVVREACGDFDAARHEASLATMEFGFAEVIDMGAARAMLSSPASADERRPFGGHAARG